MKARMRSLVAALVGMAFIGAAGCSPGAGSGDTSDGSSETDVSSSGETLANVKPCEMLPSETLKSFGLEVPGESKNELPWAPGCYYAGDPVTARLEKNTRQTVDSSAQKSVWAKFERIEVNGRAAARAVPEGATQTEGCAIMFDAGQGMIQVQAIEHRPPDSVDECAKALEIAEKIEPNVPEPA